jgi:hypothetical protein
MRGRRDRVVTDGDGLAMGSGRSPTPRFRFGGSHRSRRSLPGRPSTRLRFSSTSPATRVYYDGVARDLETGTSRPATSNLLGRQLADDRRDRGYASSGVSRHPSRPRPATGSARRSTSARRRRPGARSITPNSLTAAAGRPITRGRAPTGLASTLTPPSPAAFRRRP